MRLLELKGGHSTFVGSLEPRLLGEAMSFVASLRADAPSGIS